MMETVSVVLVKLVRDFPVSRPLVVETPRLGKVDHPLVSLFVFVFDRVCKNNKQRNT